MNEWVVGMNEWKYSVTSFLNGEQYHGFLDPAIREDE